MYLHTHTHTHTHTHVWRMHTPEAIHRQVFRISMTGYMYVSPEATVKAVTSHAIQLGYLWITTTVYCTHTTPLTKYVQGKTNRTFKHSSS